LKKGLFRDVIFDFNKKINLNKALICIYNTLKYTKMLDKNCQKKALEI